ncbi:transporter substrate-binding protein [Bradyrhizobium niftali]|jgi:branched-chain amino acid transport system substrate-binding protein
MTVRDLSRLGPDAIDGHLSSSVYFSSLNSPENAAFIHAYAQ